MILALNMLWLSMNRLKKNLSIQTQLSLLDQFNVIQSQKSDECLSTDLKYLYEKINIDKIDFTSEISSQIDLIITALGFEDRSHKSTENILNTWQPEKICLIKYPEEGKTADIKSEIKKKWI